jgi:glycosyltransferase involved in cell wall biosynthesis
LVRRAPLLPITATAMEARLQAARQVFEQVDLFVAPSPSIAREFEMLGVPGARIRVSGYGISPTRRVPRPLSRGPLRLGFVGTLVWHKGVHALIDAVRELPAESFELKIFGSPEVFPDYVALLHARAGDGPVRWMGAFDHDALPEIYTQMDVLVVPSLWLENSPLVIHEALAAGVPVVGPRLGGIADLIVHEGNGLLYDPQEPGSLTAALRRLHGDRVLLERLAEAVRNGPPAKSIAVDASEWDAVYAGVVERCRSSQP